ncbi:MAG: NAD-dependent epimerase/dehydratase family protein [Acidimicrobiia bacterium]|nr:NAD-dependent epimerase/dehydratase family protein [Acidimicrobiia bacterium]
MDEPTPVLVTGGGGFIGANLCRALVDTERYVVSVVDDFSTGHRSNLDGVDVKLYEGSILDTELLAEATPADGAVVHLAALGSVPRSVADPATSHAVNATGTVNVLEAARAAGVEQVVVASSSSVYGDNDAPAKHEGLPVAPKSPYGASKLATEAYALAHQRTYGIGVLAFRFFNVFGPLQAAGHAYAAVIPSFVDRALRGEPLIVHGDGTQSRDFTYVGTVCDTIVRAVDQRVTFDGPVNLAFGTQVPLLDVIALIEAELGVRVACDHQAPRAGDIRHSRADAGRLLSLFPETEPVDIAAGVRRTVEWFQASGRY